MAGLVLGGEVVLSGEDREGRIRDHLDELMILSGAPAIVPDTGSAGADEPEPASQLA